MVETTVKQDDGSTRDLRFCDVCDEEIAKGERYQRTTMPQAAAFMLTSLFADDPDELPEWSDNADGTITMDVCATCVMSMGDAVTEECLN